MVVTIVIITCLEGNPEQNLHLPRLRPALAKVRSQGKSYKSLSNTTVIHPTSPRQPNGFAKIGRIAKSLIWNHPAQTSHELFGRGPWTSRGEIFHQTNRGTK